MNRLMKTTSRGKHAVACRSPGGLLIGNWRGSVGGLFGMLRSGRTHPPPPALSLKAASVGGLVNLRHPKFQYAGSSRLNGPVAESCQNVANRPGAKAVYSSRRLQVPVPEIMRERPGVVPVVSQLRAGGWWPPFNP